MHAVRSVDQKIQVVELPEPNGSGVRVHVKSAGICGSDLTMLDRGFPLSHTLGHEFAGVLDDGRAVAIQPTSGCGDCECCVRGDVQLCPESMASTLGVFHDGGMADQVFVDARSLVDLPSGVSVNDACLVEPLAVAIHGISTIGLEAAEKVAVVGAGSVGLLAGAATRSHGCPTAIIARHPPQQYAAEALGLDLKPEGAFDLVIDAAGSESALQEAVRLCRPGGRLLLLAWDWENISLPGFAMASKEIHVLATVTYGHHHGTRDVDAAATLLGSEPEIANQLITHRFPLVDAAVAFATARNRKAGAIKVVLEP